MAREKVVKGLESCRYGCPGDEFPYHEGIKCADLMTDALALLKEQEAELSYREAKAITHTATKLDDATCPSCGNVVGKAEKWNGQNVFIQWKYCVFCGQALKWE